MRLEIKDLGQLHYFIGIEITHSKKVVSPRKYVRNLLEDIGLLGCKIAGSNLMPS